MEIVPPDIIIRNIRIQMTYIKDQMNTLDRQLLTTPPNNIVSTIINAMRRIHEICCQVDEFILLREYNDRIETEFTDLPRIELTLKDKLVIRENLHLMMWHIADLEGFFINEVEEKEIGVQIEEVELNENAGIVGQDARIRHRASHMLHMIMGKCVAVVEKLKNPEPPARRSAVQGGKKRKNKNNKKTKKRRIMRKKTQKKH